MIPPFVSTERTGFRERNGPSHGQSGNIHRPGFSFLEITIIPVAILVPKPSVFGRAESGASAEIISLDLATEETLHCSSIWLS